MSFNVIYENKVLAEISRFTVFSGGTILRQSSNIFSYWTFSFVTFSFVTFSVVTFSFATFSFVTFSFVTFSVVADIEVPYALC